MEIKTEYSKKLRAARPRTSKSDQPSIYFWFFKVLLVLALLAVVIWLALRPEPPVFAAGQVTAGNSSVVFNLTASNPNKRIGIYYGDLNVTVYKSNVGVWSKSVAGFYQRNRGKRWFEVAVGEAVGRGEVKLGLRTNVRYKIWRSVSESVSYRFEANVSMGLGPQGTVELRLARKLLFQGIL